MLTVQPVKFPGKGFNCVYLFHKGETAKIGRSMNLANRSLEYKGRKMACLAYAGPVADTVKAESSLVAYFGQHFKAKHRNGEWLEATAEQASAVFAEWVASQAG